MRQRMSNSFFRLPGNDRNSLKMFGMYKKNEKKEMRTRIYFVRHGMTAANLENRFAGRTGEPLHGEGVTQMEQLGRRLRKHNMARIVSSPLPRATESAAIIGRILGVPVTVDDSFTDMLIPHWDGLTKEEITACFGPEYPGWSSQPERFSVTGCETLVDVQQRSVRAMEQLLAAECGRNTLIVSHLIVLRCLVLYYADMGLSGFRSVKIANGAIGCLTSEGDGFFTVELNI